MKTCVFDDVTREFVLAMFDKAIDDEGYIIEADTQNRVMSPDGNEVHQEDFAGVAPGSEIILTNDLPSLLQYADRGE